MKKVSRYLGSAALALLLSVQAASADNIRF